MGSRTTEKGNLVITTLGVELYAKEAILNRWDNSKKWERKKIRTLSEDPGNSGYCVIDSLIPFGGIRGSSSPLPSRFLIYFLTYIYVFTHIWKATLQAFEALWKLGNVFSWFGIGIYCCKHILGIKRVCFDFSKWVSHKVMGKWRVGFTSFGPTDLGCNIRVRGISFSKIAVSGASNRNPLLIRRYMGHTLILPLFHVLLCGFPSYIYVCVCVCVCVYYVSICWVVCLFIWF